ncbi:hypothetical protein pb186bvf_016585 [Paramecium bursaria]
MQQIQEFISSRVLAVHLNTKLLGQEFEQFLEQCYLKINNNRLKRDSNDDIKNKYVELARLVPQPKPENMDLLIFIAGYLVHKKLHSQSNEEQKNIYDLRLLLDIYHILIYTVNGIMVSDTFLETCIGKFFQPHFFDYTKKIVYVPPYQKPTKFFGRPIAQTQPTSPEADQLATTFTNMFKPIRKKQALSIQETQQEFHYELISPPVRKHKININSLSPSMANALKIDTVSQPRMVNHPMQKANFGEHKVLQRLKQLNEVNQQKPEPRLPSRKVRNLFEEHGLIPPPKDFFQRSKKVDPYMRPFLEHNYVLDNRLQNMQTLPSSQIIQQDLQPYIQMKPEVPIVKKQIITTEFNFDDPSLKSTQNGFDIQATTTKASLPQFSNYSTFYKEASQTQPILVPIRTKKLKKSVSDFNYDNKIQFYQTQFDKAMNNVSTDLKISELDRLISWQKIWENYQGKQNDNMYKLINVELLKEISKYLSKAQIRYLQNRIAIICQLKNQLVVPYLVLEPFNFQVILDFDIEYFWDIKINNLYDDLKKEGIKILVNQFQTAESDQYHKYYALEIIKQGDQNKEIYKKNIDTQLFECIESAYSTALDLIRPRQQKLEQLNLLVQFQLMREDYITNEKINNPFFFFSEDNFFNNPCLIDQQTLFNHIIENPDYRSEFLKMDRHNIGMAIIVWKGYQLLQSKYPGSKIDIIIQPLLKNFLYMVDDEPYLFSETYKELYVRQSSINNVRFSTNIYTERLDKGIPINNITFFEQTNIELGQDIIQLQLKPNYKLLQQKKDYEITISLYPYDEYEKEYSSMHEEGYINIRSKKFDYYFSDCHDEGHLINLQKLYCDQCNKPKDISTIFYDTQFRDFFMIAQQNLIQHISRLYPVLLIKPLTLKRFKDGEYIFVSLNQNHQICSLIYQSITMNWNGDQSYINDIEEKPHTNFDFQKIL